MISIKRVTWIRFVLILSVVTIAFSACKDGGISEKKDLKIRSSEFLIKKLRKNSPEVSWLSSKVKVQYEGEPMDIRLSASLRMRSDSLIWISARKFGFELARIKITADSVFILNRLQREYLMEDFSHIQRMIDFPINFSILQATLLGNPVFFSNDITSSIDNNRYLLQSSGSQREVKYEIDPIKYFIRKVFLFDKINKRQLEMNLSDNKEDNFSYFRTIEAHGAENEALNIELQFYDVEFNQPQKLPFEIPAQYSRI